MRNIYLLTKNYFHCAVGTLLGKKKRAKTITGLAVIALLVAALFALMLFNAWGTIQTYIELEAGFGFSFMNLVLNEGFIMGLFVAIFFSLQKVTGGQRANDAELLLSMPCTRVEIVTAKAIAKYFFNLAVVFVLAFPFVIGYLAFYQFSITVLLGSVVALLFIPFLAVGLAYILDYVTTILFSKAAFGNLLKAGLTLVALVAFMWLYMSNISTYTGEIMPDDHIAKFAPVMWMVKIALGFDAVSILCLAAMTIPVFILGLVFFATTFDKQNQTARGRKVDIFAQPNSSPVMCVLKKDLNKFVNTPIWIINSILGALMIIALTAWMAVDSSIITELAGILTPDDAKSSITFILILGFCFSAAMSMVSCCAISLEGRNLWVLKTMPINTRDVIMGKSLLNVVLLAPVIILCSVVLAFVFNLSFIQFAILLLCPLMVNVFISFGGVFINLLYPKLDWESESAVVKQSMSVVITMLLGIAAAILPIVPVMIVGSKIIPYIGWIMLGGYTLIAAGGVALAFTKGKTLFEKL